MKEAKRSDPITSTPSPVAIAEVENLCTKMADWLPYEGLSDYEKEVQGLASGTPPNH